MRRVFIISVGILLLGSMVYLTSCDIEVEQISCGSMSCSDSSSYSNEYSNYCYETEGECEKNSGHPCRHCN